MYVGLISGKTGQLETKLELAVTTVAVEGRRDCENNVADSLYLECGLIQVTESPMSRLFSTLSDLCAPPGASDVKSRALVSTSVNVYLNVAFFENRHKAVAKCIDAEITAVTQQ